MTEQEWQTCVDPAKMLELLRGKDSERKLLLFGCSCCRRIWPHLTDDRSRGLSSGPSNTLMDGRVPKPFSQPCWKRRRR